MTQFADYQPAAAAYPAVLPHTPAFDESDVEVIQQSRFPSLLGFFTALYLVSVVTMSTASEATSWIPQVVGATLGVMWVVIGVFVKAQPLAWSKPITLFVLFTMWAGTGTLVTISGDYFWILYSTSLKVTVVTWIALQCVRTRQDFLLCCFALGITSLFVLYQGLDTIIRSLEFTGSYVKKGARAEGLLISNSNDLGEFALLVGIAGMTCLLGFKSVILRTLSVIPIGAGLYMAVASGSRMAMLGLVLAAACTYWYHFRGAGKGAILKRIIMAFLAISILGGTVYFVVNSPFFFRLTRMTSGVDAAKSEPRFLYFLSAMKATFEHPIVGLGFGGFTMHRLGMAAGGEAAITHSTVSETLCNTGVPGFLLYFGSRFAFYLLIMRARKLHLSRWDHSIVNMMMPLFWVVILFDLLSMTYQHRLVWPMLGAACGYLFTLDRQHSLQSRYAVKA